MQGPESCGTYLGPNQAFPLIPEFFLFRSPPPIISDDDVPFGGAKIRLLAFPKSGRSTRTTCSSQSTKKRGKGGMNSPGRDGSLASFPHSILISGGEMKRARLVFSGRVPWKLCCPRFMEGGTFSFIHIPGGFALRGRPVGRNLNSRRSYRASGQTPRTNVPESLQHA